MAYKAYNAPLVTNNAVNMERIIPIARVEANPFTVPEPLQNKTTAAIRVVTLPSIMADRALLKPVLMADLTVFPTPISSLIRVNIMTLASTAIPMDRIIPAIPGSVRVTSKAERRINSRPTYNPKARTEASPGIRYTPIIKRATIRNPIAAALRLVAMASWPSFAPTTFERSSSNSRDKEPIRMVAARFSASS